MSVLTLHTVIGASCPSGTNTVVRLPAPRKGILRRLSVQQSSGSLDGFTVDLFETETAANGSADAELYRLGPTLNAAASENLVQVYDVKWLYANPTEDPANPLGVQAIFARIRPSGSGTKLFNLRVGAVGTDVDTLA